MRLPWECHNQSQDTKWRHCVTGPELPLFHQRNRALKMDQSVKMPWHRLSMGVASSCSSAPGSGSFVHFGLVSTLTLGQGSQAGVVDVIHAFHLYYKCCMWIELQLISTWLRGFSPGTPVSCLLKSDSQSNPYGCGSVLRSHTWIVFRGRVPSRQHSSFGPTPLSCALWNSVYGLR